jgi:hypothetical protein
MNIMDIDTILFNEPGHAMEYALFPENCARSHKVEQTVTAAGIKCNERCSGMIFTVPISGDVVLSISTSTVVPSHVFAETALKRNDEIFYDVSLGYDSDLPRWDTAEELVGEIRRIKNHFTPK